jgi:outer membrane protein assembly factor BamD (BamD/ComL family)
MHNAVCKKPMRTRPARTNVMLFMSIALLLAGSVRAHAFTAGAAYKAARTAVRSGNLDFAFFNFKAIVQDFPKTRYYKDSLFAIGEYYFFISDFYNANRAIARYIGEFGEDPEALFAYWYLMRVAQRSGSDDPRVEHYKKQIISFKQLSLLFRDFKEFKYLSPLGRVHRAVFYIDKIEFLIDGVTIQTVSY